MARKPRDTGDPPSKKRKMTQAGQSALFIETARELDVDETGAEFKRAFKRISPLRQRTART